MKIFFKVMFPVFLLFLFVNCNKPKTIDNGTEVNEINIYETNETYLNIFIEEELKEIMYVSSTEGLNLRSKPLSQSERISILPHGLRVIVSKTQTEETINGVTSFWYETSGHIGRGYVFGAYLSKKLPEDVTPILGLWNSDMDNWVWRFSPPDIVSSGYIGTDRGWYGKWELNDNILTIIESNEFEHKEYGEELQISVSVIEIELPDIDTIILRYENGSQAKLTRSHELF